MPSESAVNNVGFLGAEIGVNQSMLPVFWGLLLASTIAWLFLSSKLYQKLKHKYQDVYEMLGCPELFMKNSFSANYRVMFFLLKRQYESMMDEEINRLCRGMRLVLFIFVLSLTGCSVIFLARLF